ncbi:MAG: hypothetical protein M3Y82_02980 [Verrucomicrobiota bacterium]|nr:hypothetical protein [Verrucomicrobiota bacterium]
MTPKEFEERYPRILEWIEQTIAQHVSQACTIASLGFKRLPDYFSAAVLGSAKVVYVLDLPKPPLSALGLSQFSEFENMDGSGITYLDTFFSREEMRGNEPHHFHELVHVIQWQALGPKQFLQKYADGLERMGYRNSPLEVMAYTLENVFRNSSNPFDVAAIVRDQLAELFQPYESR